MVDQSHKKLLKIGTQAKTEFNSQSGISYYQLAVKLQKDGDTEGAIKNQNLAIEINPNFSESYFKLAQLFNKLGNIEKAKQNIGYAIEINPTIARYYILLGNLNWQAAAISEAEKNYLKSIELDSSLSAPHFRLSKIHEKKGQLDNAITEVKIALDLDPEMALYRHHYSELLIQTGSVNTAIEEKNIAQKLSPLKFSFCKNEVTLRAMLYSGELVIIPAGFRCYTKGILYRKLKFNQPSLPFDNGFFPPDSIASVLKDASINLSMESHTICIKEENHHDDELGLGIDFKASDYQTVNKYIEKGVNKGKYLDSTSGYYTLDPKHGFILAHYNWHESASYEKSKGVYDTKENLANINDMFNKRLSRMFDMCNKAKSIIFIVGNTQDYQYMSIDDKKISLYDTDSLSATVKELFGLKSKVLLLQNIHNIKDIFEYSK